jgi:hypothetical protein
MILRDLVFKRGPEVNKYWEVCLIALRDGRHLRVTHPRETNNARSPANYWVYLRDDSGVITLHVELDEFEAQAVLDHYLQKVTEP